MVGFVDSKRITPADIESLTGDNTVGIVRARRDEHLRGDVLFDLRRLRRAIIAFEEEFDASLAEVAILENAEENGQPGLALVPEEGGARAVMLASRTIDGSKRTGADGLITTDGGSA